MIMNKEYIHKDTRTDEPLHVQIETLTRWQDPTIYEKDKEIKRLNNIINEFEKYLINEIKRLENVEQTPSIILITGKIHDIYDELQKLKEG